MGDLRDVEIGAPDVTVVIEAMQSVAEAARKACESLKKLEETALRLGRQMPFTEEEEPCDD